MERVYVKRYEPDYSQYPGECVITAIETVVLAFKGSPTELSKYQIEGIVEPQVYDKGGKMLQAEAYYENTSWSYIPAYRFLLKFYFYLPQIPTVSLMDPATWALVMSIIGSITTILLILAVVYTVGTLSTGSWPSIIKTVVQAIWLWALGGIVASVVGVYVTTRSKK